MSGLTGVSTNHVNRNSSQEDLYAKQRQIQEQIDALKAKMAHNPQQLQSQPVLNQQNSFGAILPQAISQRDQNHNQHQFMNQNRNQGLQQRSYDGVLMPQNSNIPSGGPPKNKIPPMHPSMYPPSESRRSEPRQLPRPPLYQPRNENDMAEVRIRGKNNYVETRAGSITRTLGQQDDSSKLKKELKEGRKRLQVLEQLEQYREEKVRKEMLMLEMQRK